MKRLVRVHGITPEVPPSDARQSAGFADVVQPSKNEVRRPMKTTLVLVALSLSVFGCGSDPRPADPTINLSSVPSAATLCQLAPYASTSAEVRSVLGNPFNSQTFSDGSSTFMFEYDAHPTSALTIAVLQIWFTTGRIFSSATVSNLDMPSCWHFDGGL